MRVEFLEGIAVVGHLTLIELLVSKLKCHFNLVDSQPVNVGADVVHVFSARIWHVCQLSECREQRSFEVCIDLAKHLLGIGISFDCVYNLCKAHAVVTEVADHILCIVLNRIQCDRFVDIRPLYFSTVQSFKLNSCTIKRSLLARCLCIDLIGRVAMRDEIAKEIAQVLTIRVVVIDAKTCAAVEVLEFLIGVRCEVKRFRVLPLTVAANFNREDGLPTCIFTLFLT